MGRNRELEAAFAFLMGREFDPGILEKRRIAIVVKRVCQRRGFDLDFHELFDGRETFRSGTRVNLEVCNARRTEHICEVILVAEPKRSAQDLGGVRACILFD